MREKTDKAAEKIVKSISGKFIQDSQVKEYEKNLSTFKDMVQKGYIKERGNNLAPITDKTSNFISFNA